MEQREIVDVVKIKGPINTELVLRDQYGRLKQLWQPSWLGKVVDRWLGADVRVSPFGTWVYAYRTHNLVTNVGHAGANGRMSNQGSYGVFTTIAIGVGTTAATISDSALGSESTTGGAARAVAGGISQVTTTVTNDTTQLVKTFTFTAALAISEEGIFDTATAPPTGNLLAKQVFATINVSSGDTLTIDFSGLGVRALLNKLVELLGSLNPFTGMVISSQAYA